MLMRSCDLQKAAKGLICGQNLYDKRWFNIYFISNLPKYKYYVKAFCIEMGREGFRLLVRGGVRKVLSIQNVLIELERGELHQI